MDWKALAYRANTLKDQAIELTQKGYETSKEYARDAGVKSYTALTTGSTGITSIESFEMIKDSKRLAIFCLEKDTPVTKKLLLLFPIVFTKAWIESGTVRVVDKENIPHLPKTLEINKVPSVLIFQQGECVKKMEESEEILTFMKNFTFAV